MLVAIDFDVHPFEGKHIPQSSTDITGLIRACAVSGSDSAWRELIVRFRRPIAFAILRVARRWGAFPHEVVDDLVQDTLLKLCADKCARFYQFSCEHPEAVDAYVKTIAGNVAHDFFKALKTIKRGSGETVQLLDTFEAKAELSSLGGVEAIERELLLREIDNCLETNVEGASKSRDRSIFWLHYKQGMTAAAIASIPAVRLTTKGVESVLLRLTRLVRGKMAARARPHPDAPATAKGFGSVESF